MRGVVVGVYGRWEREGVHRGGNGREGKRLEGCEPNNIRMCCWERCEHD